MTTETKALDWYQTAMGRSVYIAESDLPAENAKELHVCNLLRAAPSFPALLKAVHRFKRDLYGPSYVAATTEAKPWETLTAYAGVMNAKSARAETLRKLSIAVFRETGLPRQKGGTFRGSDGLDWKAVNVG
jgi:hypothetical protein